MDAAAPCVLKLGRYLEDDGGARFLLQDARGAERLEGGVGVVDEVGVVVEEQRLHVVEDEAELVGTLHCVQSGPVFQGEGRGQARHGGRVQHFTHLGKCSTHTGIHKRGIYTGGL